MSQRTSDISSVLRSPDIDNMSDQEINEAYDKLMNIKPEEKKEDNTELTEENVKDIIKAAQHIPRDPETELYDKIQNGEIDTTTMKEELESKESYAHIDPATGKIKYTLSSPGGETDIDALIDEKTEDVEVTEDNVYNSVKKIYGEELSDDDARIILKLVKRFQNGDTRIRYNDLPAIIKNNIAKTIMEENNAVYMGSRDLKDRMTRTFIEGVSSEAMIEQINDVYVDLANTINKYATEELSNSMDSITKNQRNMFETKFLEFADKAEADGKPEMAETMRNTSKWFKEAYTYETMYNTYANTGKIKIKKIELEKPQRVYQSMLDKYVKSKYNIRNVAMLEPILDRHLPDWVDMEDIRAFIIVFCKFCMNFSPEVLEQHTFMYYFIYNICMLDMHNETNEESKVFYDELTKNIVKFIELIRKKRGKE